MLISVEGVFKNGVVELLDPPPDRAESSRVVVTFLPPRATNDLASLGMTLKQAAEIRSRAGAIAEDWDHPDMDV